jgi:hypothetical protein
LISSKLKNLPFYEKPETPKSQVFKGFLVIED